MKRIVALIIAMLMLVSLAACGGSSDTPGNTSAATDSSKPDSGKTDESKAPEGTDGKYLADIYGVYEKICNGMMECVNDVVEKSFEAGKSSTDYVNFLGFNDVGLTNFNLAGSFDGQDMSITKMALAILTSEDLVLDTTSDGYVLKFTSYNGDSVESTFRYDISSMSVSFVEKRNGTLYKFFDMANLGNGKYALLSNTERAIVDFDGKNVTGFYYSKLLNNSYDKIYNENDYASASVYGKTSADNNWVTELRSENKIEKIWDCTQSNKLVVSTLLKSEYDDDGNKSYAPCDPVKESVYEY